MALFVVGLFSINRLSVDAFPDVTNVQVQIAAEVPGRSPVEVERFVTVPIEIAMTGLPGLTDMRSLNRNGIAIITLVFTDNTDIYFARQMVLERLIEVMGRMPPGVTPVLKAVCDVAALALAASALTTHAASVDDWLRTTGTQQAHARLQALAQEHAGWRVLSLLWPQPELIQPAARALGLTTTEQAAALADAPARHPGHAACRGLHPPGQPAAAARRHQHRRHARFGGRGAIDRQPTRRNRLGQPRVRRPAGMADRLRGAECPCRVEGAACPDRRSVAGRPRHQGCKASWHRIIGNAVLREGTRTG